MAERDYQPKLIKRLRREFDGCVILKNDAGYMQGVPDLIILYLDRWAMLEVKWNAASPFRPNQEYYIDMLNQMSYSSVVYPENEDQVFADLHHVLSRR